MSKVESFEEIFKSEAKEECCPTCGGEVEVVEKGGKKKMKAKGTAKMVGNEMDPHKGGKTGSFVTGRPRPGSVGGAVNRQASANPRPKSGVVKALFPMSAQVQLVEYGGLSSDASLAKSIEDSQDSTKAHNLFVPSARNLAMENEAGQSEE